MARARDTEGVKKDAAGCWRIFWQTLKAAIMACVLIPNISMIFTILKRTDLPVADKVGMLIGMFLFIFVATAFLYGRQIIRAMRTR